MVFFPHRRTWEHNLLQINGVHSYLFWEPVSTHIQILNSIAASKQALKNLETSPLFNNLNKNHAKARSLDKWKNISMLHEAHQIYPNLKWHVYIDADMFLGFPIVQTFQALENTVLYW